MRWRRDRRGDAARGGTSGGHEAEVVVRLLVVSGAEQRAAVAAGQLRVRTAVRVGARLEFDDVQARVGLLSGRLLAGEDDRVRRVGPAVAGAGRRRVLQDALRGLLSVAVRLRLLLVAGYHYVRPYGRGRNGSCKPHNICSR